METRITKLSSAGEHEMYAQSKNSGLVTDPPQPYAETVLHMHRVSCLSLQLLSEISLFQ